MIQFHASTNECARNGNPFTETNKSTVINGTWIARSLLLSSCQCAVKLVWLFHVKCMLHSKFSNILHRAWTINPWIHFWTCYLRSWTIQTKVAVCLSHPRSKTCETSDFMLDRKCKLCHSSDVGIPHHQITVERPHFISTKRRDRSMDWKPTGETAESFIWHILIIDRY